MIIAGNLLAMLLLLMGLTMSIYRKVFGRRYNASDKPSALHFGDFPSLQREKAVFPSGKHLLTGYFYRDREHCGNRPLMVFCHGIGHGHTDYLNHIAYWTAKGYTVFAFDATGFGESEGKDVRGMIQPALDTHAALCYIEQTRPQEVPLLYGHSWGAFACTAALHYPHRVRGVVALAGFHCSRDAMTEKGGEMVGPIVKLMRWALKVIEHLRFGKLCLITATEGIANTDAKVLVLHSDDDAMVGKSGIFYQEAIAQNPRVQRVPLQGKGHDVVLSDEALRYAKESNAQYRACGTDRKKLVRYFTAFDKKKRYQLDENVMQIISDFLDACQ